MASSVPHDFFTDGLETTTNASSSTTTTTTSSSSTSKSRSTQLTITASSSTITETATTAETRPKYPPDPIKPSDDDCCGSGCSTCVFDLYELELSKWRERCQQIDDGEDENTAEEVISVYEYRQFRLTDIETDYGVTYFTFEVPSKKRLPLMLGQHLVARYILLHLRDPNTESARVR